MLFQRRTNYRWLILIPIGILILIGGGVALSRGRPRVTDIFPPPDAVAIPGLAPVRVAFSRPMNWESVTQNLDIQPRQAGDTSWDGDTLTFNPTQPWPGGETVTVRLSTAARASIGLPLAEPQTWSFTVARTMLA
ncbi:MAG: Ig-like domain-containing protein, partial [Anaerolineales bacterium]